MRTSWIRPVAVDCEVFVEVETERAPKKRTNSIHHRVSLKVTNLSAGVLPAA